MNWSVSEAVGAASAAGEPTRLRILALLAREELAVAELGRVLEQSQPRVSRHLRLLAQAGLVERFPDGAWVFYRLATDGPGAQFTQDLLARLDAADPLLVRDRARLEAVEADRRARASAYFAANAARWDDMRALHAADAEVEAAVSALAGRGPFRRLVDLGTGTGRMLRLLGPRAETALGLDLSQQMLNVARAQTAGAGLARCELRHGDIRATGLPDGWADLVVVHQVLHYLGEPAAAVAEAARLVAPGGRLLVVDFAPHGLEFLREAHQHRRLGFADQEMTRWLVEAGLEPRSAAELPPGEGARDGARGLTVKIWAAERTAGLEQERAAA